MDRETLRQRLMTTFLAELGEHAQALERQLLAIEKDDGSGRAQQLLSLFRAVHSLKGAARSVGVRPIELACHRLETLIGALRDGPGSLTPRTTQLLYAAADALRDAGERLHARRELGGGRLERLLPVLDEALRAFDGRPAPATPVSAPPPTPEAEEVPRHERTVRVAVGKLDALLTDSGELLVARRRAFGSQDDIVRLHDDLRRWRSAWRRCDRPIRKLLASHGSRLPMRAATEFERAADHFRTLERRAEQIVVQMAAENRRLERAALTVEADIRSVRMFPFSHACEGLERTVRDVAHQSGKDVRLHIEGGDIQAGRLVLEALNDPLRHLVRNAVDHGIEPIAEREAAGKPRQGSVSVTARLRGIDLEVVVADDGRGLDLGAVRAQASRRGMAAPADDREAARLVFLPGFTTARLVTEVSGRGIGLDVVKHLIETMHGHADIESEPGRGTRVVVTLPLTLTTIRALMVRAAGHVFALPVTSVRRLARVTPDDLAWAGGREVLSLDGAPIPIVSLAEVLGMGRPPAIPAGRKVPLVVLAPGNTPVAFAVDELLAEDEILVKGLGRRLARVRHFSGATILPTGRLGLILNVTDLVQTAMTHTSRAPLAVSRTGSPGGRRRRLLVADDSVTTRTLETSLLEAAGYEVVAAVDGSDAWRLLQDGGVDLVVADVEMPRMDGITLCEAIRRSRRFRDLPVVLVTARDTESDKARGLQAGAQAYLPKSTFDEHQLLDTIARLL